MSVYGAEDFMVTVTNIIFLEMRSKCVTTQNTGR